MKEGIYDKHGQLIEDGYSDEDDYEDEEEPMWSISLLIINYV